MYGIIANQNTSKNNELEERRKKTNHNQTDTVIYREKEIEQQEKKNCSTRERNEIINIYGGFFSVLPSIEYVIKQLYCWYVAIRHLLQTYIYIQYYLRVFLFLLHVSLTMCMSILQLCVSSSSSMVVEVFAQFDFFFKFQNELLKQKKTEKHLAYALRRRLLLFIHGFSHDEF